MRKRIPYQQKIPKRFVSYELREENIRHEQNKRPYEEILERSKAAKIKRKENIDKQNQLQLTESNFYKPNDSELFEIDIFDKESD